MTTADTRKLGYYPVDISALESDILMELGPSLHDTAQREHPDASHTSGRNHSHAHEPSLEKHNYGISTSQPPSLPMYPTHTQQQQQHQLQMQNHYDLAQQISSGNDSSRNNNNSSENSSREHETSSDTIVLKAPSSKNIANFSPEPTTLLVLPDIDISAPIANYTDSSLINPALSPQLDSEYHSVPLNLPSSPILSNLEAPYAQPERTKSDSLQHLPSLSILPPSVPLTFPSPLPSPLISPVRNFTSSPSKESQFTLGAPDMGYPDRPTPTQTLASIDVHKANKAFLSAYSTTTTSNPDAILQPSQPIELHSPVPLRPKRFSITNNIDEFDSFDGRTLDSPNDSQHSQHTRPSHSSRRSRHSLISIPSQDSQFHDSSPNLEMNAYENEKRIREINSSMQPTGPHLYDAPLGNDSSGESVERGQFNLGDKEPSMRLHPVLPIDIAQRDTARQQRPPLSVPLPSLPLQRINSRTRSEYVETMRSKYSFWFHFLSPVIS